MELCPVRTRVLASVLPDLFGCTGMLLSYVPAYTLPCDMATAVSAVPILPLSLMPLLVGMTGSECKWLYCIQILIMQSRYVTIFPIPIAVSVLAGEKE